MSHRRKSLLKIIVLGDSGVGKTSLMSRYVQKKFSPHFKATIGADFLHKDVTLDDRLTTLQIWDTAGQERFMSLGVAFYRGSDACVLVYDICDQKSFENLNNWKKEFVDYAGGSSDQLPFVLLGNKGDLDDQRAVDEKQVDAWCKKHGIPHFVTSAKENSNVDQAFENVATRALARASQVKATEIDNPFPLPDDPKPKQTSCC